MKKLKSEKATDRSASYFCSFYLFHFLTFLGRAACPRYFLRSICVTLFLFFVGLVVAQDLPKEIRGYKVQKAKIIVAKTPADVNDFEAFVKLVKPEVSDVSITGITLAVRAEIRAVAHSGKIDFLTFHDFRVNGIPVEIEEYGEPFAFNSGKKIVIPKPAQVFLPTTGIINIAWNEIRDSKKNWKVTGRVFVFGKFRKMGFYFKRVVPIDIEVVIENPLLPKPA